LLKDGPDGRLKMFVTAMLLRLRRAHPDLFFDGEYVPLKAIGARSEHVIAFARRLRDEWVIIAVPRLCASLTRAGDPPIGKKVWRDTRIEPVAGMPSEGKDVFTGRVVSTERLSDLFGVLPVSVLTYVFG
jgi:(1->4)-alpha-D-glucan 1-alpha-D-glucosylmutase